MSNMGMSFNFNDVVKFNACLMALGDKTTKRCVNRAAGRAATIVGRRIRAEVPRGKTHQLSKGFKRKKERSRVTCKAVYQYAMDSAKNNVFQKPIKNPGALGGKHKYWGYYPNSVEYGFLARAKGGGIEYHRIGRLISKSDDYWKKSTNNFQITGTTRHKIKAVEIVTGYKSKKVPGQYNVRKAAMAAEPQVFETVKRELFTELDKEWKK